MKNHFIWLAVAIAMASSAHAQKTAAEKVAKTTVSDQVFQAAGPGIGATHITFVAGTDTAAARKSVFQKAKSSTATKSTGTKKPAGNTTAQGGQQQLAQQGVPKTTVGGVEYFITPYGLHLAGDTIVDPNDALLVVADDGNVFWTGSFAKQQVPVQQQMPIQQQIGPNPNNNTGTATAATSTGGNPIIAPFPMPPGSAMAVHGEGWSVLKAEAPAGGTSSTPGSATAANTLPPGSMVLPNGTTITKERVNGVETRTIYYPDGSWAPMDANADMAKIQLNGKDLLSSGGEAEAMGVRNAYKMGMRDASGFRNNYYRNASNGHPLNAVAGVMGVGGYATGGYVTGGVYGGVMAAGRPIVQQQVIGAGGYPLGALDCNGMVSDGRLHGH